MKKLVTWITISSICGIFAATLLASLVYAQDPEPEVTPLPPIEDSQLKKFINTRPGFASIKRMIRRLPSGEGSAIRAKINRTRRIYRLQDSLDPLRGSSDIYRPYAVAMQAELDRLLDIPDVTEIPRILVPGPTR